jgi:hypothetical protein
MRQRREGTKNGPETGEKPVSKLSGVPPLTHDPDDRPTREDREGHGSPFAFPVPLPRILQRRGPRKKRD